MEHIKNRENPLDQEKDKHGPINQHTTLNDGIYQGTRVSGYQGLKPSLNLSGSFMIIPFQGLEISVLSWGYPPITQATDDHDLVKREKPMVRTGDPRLDSQSKANHFSGALQPAVSWAKLPGAEDGSS